MPSRGRGRVRGNGHSSHVSAPAAFNTDLMISDSSNPPSGLLGTPGADPLDILDREGLALAAPNLTPNIVNMIPAALPEILPEITPVVPLVPVVQRVAPKTHTPPRVTSPAPLAPLVIARTPQETEAILVAMQRRIDALEAFQAAHLVNPVMRPAWGTKWPTPGKMGVPLFKSAVSKPHILDNEVEGICAWLRAHHLPIPDHLPHFIEDYDVKDFVKSYFKSLPVDVPFIEEDFKTSLKRFVSGEVRSQVAIARATLVGRELKQGPDSAAKYAQRFFQCSRLIPDECQVSLCLHYLAGLNPELKQACTLDRDGNEWQSLSSLVKYSYGVPVE
ncbi:hypothetical protein CEUSTIGMA_g12107.t1 [Chlamydomonas eustigma]|uniref:Retrotransposon gag domain-containing protein n=1 Tax=Chlamydomonas eustigma TaxID=1157962 RepID=A0A250XNU0_9CHLO|nr:hypothetical protein CEUSTIGMA_g12107.t1 [Chlamydomonas eustigma]|eukprot:GAX84686.1 hypothetical protein CEUSTIGMA_g12107.t1 [Chlamydomonas eustigma]